MITTKIKRVFKIKPRLITSCFLHRRCIYEFNSFIWIGLAHYDKDNNKEKQNVKYTCSEDTTSSARISTSCILDFGSTFFWQPLKNLGSLLIFHIFYIEKLIRTFSAFFWWHFTLKNFYSFFQCYAWTGCIIFLIWAHFHWGSEFSSYEIELRNRVTQNDITLRVTNSKSKNKKLHFELLTRRLNFYFFTFKLLTRS